MPEFKEQAKKDGYTPAFNSWNASASKLGNEQIQLQIIAKREIIYDRTCAQQKLFDLIKSIVEKGYRLVFYMLCINVEKAISRAKSRELVMGRHIPEEISREFDIELKRLLPHYLSISSEAYLLDNTDKERKIIAQLSNGVFEIHNQEKYYTLVVENDNQIKLKSRL